MRAHPQRCHPVDQGDAQLAGGQQRDAGGDPPQRRWQCAHALQQYTAPQHGDHGDRQQVHRQCNASCAWARWFRCAGCGWVAQRATQQRQSRIHQVIAHVAGHRCIGARLRGQAQDALGHRRLVAVQALRQMLHHMPVAIAGVEIHACVDVGRILAQDLLYHAHGLDEVAPIHLIQKPQAADAVADRHLFGGLALALGMHQAFHTVAFACQPLLHPGAGHRQHRPAALDAARQLGHERAGGRRLRARHIGHHHHHVLGLRRRRGVEQRGPMRGQAGVAAIVHDVFGNAAQVVDQPQP